MEEKYDQIQHITRALKVITDSLPFEETFIQFAKDEELIKYLIVSIPFDSNNIEYIINLLVYKLQD